MFVNDKTRAAYETYYRTLIQYGSLIFIRLVEKYRYFLYASSVLKETVYNIDKEAKRRQNFVSISLLKNTNYRGE